MIESEWTPFDARVVPGHRVASGCNGNPRFPGGTLQMQTPFFQALGLDLTAYYRGTINVSLAPLKYRVVKARYTFRAVKWHPAAPPEDFSFFDVRLLRDGAEPGAGLIYFPHPETKPEHFQRDDVLELLLPFVEGIGYGAPLKLAVPTGQMMVL
jgi:hypothetical protein